MWVTPTEMAATRNRIHEVQLSSLALATADTEVFERVLQLPDLIFIALYVRSTELIRVYIIKKMWEPI